MPKQSILILVANHNGATVPEHPYIRSIQVGSANSVSRFTNMLHDDTGENISERNASYCELTAVYWAWKNAQADYIGLFHYRRVLSLNPHVKRQRDGFSHMEVLDSKAIEALSLTPEMMEASVKRKDILLMKPINVYEMTAGTCLTVGQQFELVPGHHMKDLTKAIGILKTLYPSYTRDALKYLNGENGWYCNMFIMKRETFNAYCEWLFPILDQLYAYQISDYSHRPGTYEGRMIGFIAERLQGIYITHLIRTQKKIKIGYLPPVFFEGNKKANTADGCRPLPFYKWELRRIRMRMKKRSERIRIEGEKKK